MSARATRILLAESDPITSRTIAAFLRARDFDVHTVRTASAVLDQPVPDVLVASAGLPDRSVFELCEELAVSAVQRWSLVT